MGLCRVLEADPLLRSGDPSRGTPCKKRCWNSQLVTNNSANPSARKGKVCLSRIFKWYKNDFPADIYGYLPGYADKELRGQNKRPQIISLTARILKTTGELMT